MDIYEVLNYLKISYYEVTHKAVYTIKETINEDIKSKISGEECKCLFLKSKNNYYLVLLEAFKMADLKQLAELVNEKKLSFAGEYELNNVLNLNIGGVTPLGIINDKNNIVTLLIDKDLENKKILMHADTNTKTISIKYKDLIKVIDYTNHKYVLF